MTRFIVNIALHSAGKPDYKKLQQEMEKEAFSSVKKITEKDKGYLLQIAEFSRTGTFTLKEITDAACRAAKNTGKEFSFTVIKDKHPAIHLPAGRNAVA
jgi:hypothetical protein